MSGKQNGLQQGPCFFSTAAIKIQGRISKPARGFVRLPIQMDLYRNRVRPRDHGVVGALWHCEPVRPVHGMQRACTSAAFHTASQFGELQLARRASNFG
jgi:hypothetical protein